MAGVLGLSGSLTAQSPDWSSALTISPSPSPYLADWERVPSTALLSLTYTGTTAADFRVRVTLNSNERGLIGTTESPTVTLGGGPSSFLYSVRDAVFEWTTVSRNQTATDGAIKTGQIPEGSYRACARVFVGTATTHATEACADFSILQPDPPQLLAPQDRETVVSTQPFFQWTPVLAPPTVPVSYEVTVVELIDRQEARTALEANRPVLRSIATTPFLIYPIDALQLERAKRYAWRVRAVDDAGRQLFRDGAQSEIWTFAMSSELLEPIGKIAEMPDTLVLIPGVAQLTGVRQLADRTSDTEVTIDGRVRLEFLGGGEVAPQSVAARRLRAGYRDGTLSLIAGRIEGTVPAAMVPADVRGLLTFAPFVFTPATGFRATASLKIPGAPAVPLTGTVQLTAGGLSGRLEGAGAAGAPIARVGRAPVQYAAHSARLTLPEGRLEFVGKVLLFEQDVGCAASGPLQQGAVRIPVFCEPASGFRPDLSSTRSLITFGTLVGSLAADFLTDTLGTYLQAPATFSVLGEGNASCSLQFTMGFARDSIWRADEQQSCAVDAATKDFGWVKLEFSNLRLTRLEYAPGATLTWRALVDAEATVRGAENLQPPVIHDVVLDNSGVQFPSSNSAAPGTTTYGIVELDGIEVLPITLGFRGGLFTYAQWLGDTDPGLEWGSATSWLRLPQITMAVSNCINAMPFTVDTLIIKAGRLDAALNERVWEGGCRLRADPKFHMMVTRASGRITIALDSVAKVTELPLVAGDALDPSCGLECVDFLTRHLLTGDIRLTQQGRLRGQLSGFQPMWSNFDLAFAKLKLTGGNVALGVDSTGGQTAIYDGLVKVSFNKIDTTKNDTTTKKDTSAAAGALGVAQTVGVVLFGSPGDTARSIAKIDYIKSRLLGGRIALKGPFRFELGFVHFVIGEAMLDSTGLTVDGRQKVVVKKTTQAQVASDAVLEKAATDTTAAVEGKKRQLASYTFADDTIGVTFANVRFDPGSMDVAAGTITFDGSLALEASPFSAVVAVGTAGIGGAISGGAAGAGTGLTTATSGTAMLGFSLVQAAGAFDPGGSFGNVRLNLPTTPTIDAQGMRVNGVAPANAAFAGSRFDSASVSFENGFAMKPGVGRVTAGRLLLKVRQYPIATLDQTGWHLALAELVATVIPDTLFLFDKWSAYVVLRDAQRELLVNVAETDAGPRITTKVGTPVKIVIPALKGSRESPPAVLVAMDLTLEKGTWRPLAGEVRAMAGGSADDDFNDIDFPFELDSVIFRATQSAAPSFFAHGRLDVWPGEFKPMRIALGIMGAGEITANVEQSFVDSLPLVSGSALVKFHIDTLRFTAQGKLGQGFQWLLETPGRLAFYDTETRKESILASATFRLSPSEAALVNFSTTDSLTTIRLPGIDLRLGRVRAPMFRWDFPRKRFDFELLFDVGLLIPALDSLKLPEIRDIRLTNTGIVIPAFEMPSTPVTPEPGSPFVTEVQQLRIGGFSVAALGYRVSEFRWDWFSGAPPPQFNFGVDLEFGIEDLPSGTEGQSARIALRALNVGITNGRFTGSFEPIQIPTPIRTSIADIRGAFGSFSVGAGQPPVISIGVIADLRLPDLLACPDAASRKVSLQSASDTLFLSSNGTLRGSVRNVVPTCPMALGPFDLRFGTSTATFGYDPTARRVTAILDAAATLSVPGDAPGETVSATGRIVIDIANARIADASIAIDEPFFWAPDSANPFLRLIVSEAAPTLQELRFGATGQLRTSEGVGVDVAFDSVAFNLNTLKLTSGRIRITANAAVGIEIPESGQLRFGVYPVSTPRGTTASARLVLPAGAVIDSSGLRINGTASASLGFGGQTYAALNGVFTNFTIAVWPRVAIRRGRLDLRGANNDLIAYADSLGFWPGNVFAVLPIPARLGIPSVDVAYIQLRSPTDTSVLLVETVFSGETVRVRTRPNERVQVGIPALAGTGPVPVVMAEFDLVLNTRSMHPVSGALALEAAPGQALIALAGMPISITQLGFRADTGGFRLRAGATAKLPGPLSGVKLEFRDLEVSAQGLTGVVELGDFSETFNANATPIVTRDLLGDTLTLAFTGAELTLAGANTRLRISGAIRSSLFKAPTGATRVINLAATVDSAGFRATADLSDAETPIPIGVAELTLQSSPGQPALVVEANATEFAITIGASLALPTIAPGFSLGVEGMKVGTAGVRIPNVSITAPANTKEFQLFGARFALRDSTVGTTQVAPAIGIQLNQGVMRFTVSGYVTMLANTTRFIGLRFGTDGSFSLQGASFLSRPIDIIPNVARFVSANITNGGLELVGDVKLPAPFAQGAPQELRIRIMPNGTITGGGKAVIISEPAGLATAQTKLKIGVAAFHLRHLDLQLDFATAANNAVSLVADIYIQEKQANLVKFGSVQGGTVTPGLRIALSGDVTFGNFSVPNPITLDMDPLTLVLKNATSTTTPTGFALSISGSVALKLAGASGSLAFTNVGFTSEGEVKIGQARFNGGTFTIQDKVRIVVGNIAWSDSDTSIYVPRASPPGAGGVVRPDSALVAVSSFLDFGATVDIAGVFGGGVDRLLVYVQSDDATTHFLIQNLRVEIPGVIEFRGSLSYDQLPDGFDLALSTQGRLLSAYEINLVGVMGKRGDVFRAGLFLRLRLAVPIVIVPGIVSLTEVGGGIFVNPTAADLMLVKNAAGLTGPSANRVGMPPAGKFAVMLYAGFAVAGTGGAAAAVGSAMVTITDMAFQINAKAVFFGQTDKITGDLALQVGWTPAAYVRGDISLLISIPKTVAGTASIQFFAGSNIFAIKGNLDLLVIEVVQAYAEVIIVPSGFTANLGFRIEKQTAVVGVLFAANLRMWYRPSTSDLGAYLKVAGQVTVFGVTGRLEIVGALVIEPELALYAQGSAQIVGIEAAKVEVWVQYTSEGVKAGIGHNEELATVLANAERIAAELEAEADGILAGIDAAARERALTPIAVSEASLIAAYQNFQRWNWAQLLVLWGGYRLGEGGLRGGLLPIGATDPYVVFYERTLVSTEAAADTALVRQLREEATQKLAVINDRRAAVEERISALRLELDAAESAAAFIPPLDPVTQWDFGSPTLVPGPAGIDGRPTMIVMNPPVFELNDQRAADAQAAMTEAQATNEARPGRLRDQLDAVEAGLATVIAATSANDAGSFASYARVHSDAVEAIEHQHAANVDFRMRRRSWTQSKLDTLALQREGLLQRLNGRLAQISAYQASLPSKTDATRRHGTSVELDSLAAHRSRFLSAWAGDPSIRSTYLAEATPKRAEALANVQRLRADANDGAASAQLDLAITWFQTQAVNYGLQDWWGVANAGLTVARDGAQAMVDSANAAAQPVIRAMRDMHARFTTDLGELNERQKDLYGVLFDLYDAYLRTYGATDSIGQRYVARRTVLTEMLRTPTVTNPRVTVTDFGYLSSVNTTWTGTHPRGVYEYLIQDGDDSLFTVGAQGTTRRWQYTVNPAGSSTPRNQTVLVRGGAGFTGSAATPYTVTFLRGSAGSPVTEVAVPPVDLSAPSMPVVGLSNLATLTDSYGRDEFWTGDSSRVVASWSASDAQSGVASYEYRVVTLPVPPPSTGALYSISTGTEAMTAARLAAITPVPLTGWTSAGGRTSSPIPGLNLPPNRRIFIEVRATNGAGLVGEAGSSPPIRYDPTPPVFPVGTTIAPALIAMTGFFWGGTYTVPGTQPLLLPVCGTVFASRALPVWDGRLVTVTPDNAVVGGGATARLSFTRPTASDPETGIAGYYFRVDSLPPVSMSDLEGWTIINETGSTFTAMGPNLPYGRSRYVSLAARNVAGRMSAPVTHGPNTVGDGTTASKPGFCAGYSTGGVISYMTAPSTDDETGVRGYQLRVVGPTGAIARDFPTGTTVDWPASQAIVDRGIRLPFVPSLGGLHTVEMRAVNGAGAPGDAARSGQMLIDVTPAPVAGVTATVVSAGQVVLNLVLANDPESGLAGLDIAFGNSAADPTLHPRSTGTILVPYAPYPAFVGQPKLTITLPASAWVTPLYVYVRVRNGAGLVSTATVVSIR